LHRYTLVGSETIDGHDVFVFEATPATEREAESEYRERRVLDAQGQLAPSSAHGHDETMIEIQGRLARVDGALIAGLDRQTPRTTATGSPLRSRNDPRPNLRAHQHDSRVDDTHHPHQDAKRWPRVQGGRAVSVRARARGCSSDFQMARE
jgi:hypothetical protein